MKRNSRQTRRITAAAVLLLVALSVGMPGAFSVGAAPVAQAVPNFGLVKNINPSGSSNPHNLTAFCCNKPVLFAADDGVNGVELWSSDGTDAGTFLLKDINPSGDSFPAGMEGSGTFIFSTDDGTNGTELWRTFGTEATTVLERDINPGPPGSFPMEIVLQGSSSFYFTADDGVNGREVWRKKFSGFTQADIRPGASSSAPHGLTVVGSTLFFAADDGANGTELWSTDGSTSGSTLIASMVKGTSIQEAPPRQTISPKLGAPCTSPLTTVPAVWSCGRATARAAAQSW